MTKSHPNRAWLVTTLFAGISGALGLLALALDLPRAVERGIHLGLGLALANGMLSYFTLRWAFSKTDKVFFSAMVGGIFWRLILLGAAAFFVVARPGYDFLSTLLTLVFSTSLFLFLEFEHLPKKVAAHGL